MKRIFTLESKHFRQWDLFVKQHPHGSVYHLSGWKQALEKSFKHMTAKYIIVWDEGSEKIVAGLPIFAVRSRLTGNRIVSVPMAWQCPPLVSSAEDFELLKVQLMDLYHKERARYIEIRSPMPSPDIIKWGFKASYNHTCHYLPLDCGPEALLKRFHKKAVRVPISKASKNGLKLKLGENESDLVSFYNIFFKSRQSLGLPLIPYAFFKGLWDHFNASKRLTILLAMHRDKVVGSALNLTFKQTVMCEYGCDLKEYRKLYTNHFLDWESIKLAIKEGYETFNFGRSSQINEGLLTYKKRWAADSINLPYYFFPANAGASAANNQQSAKHSLIRATLKRSPTPIFKFISKMICRQMG